MKRGVVALRKIRAWRLKLKREETKARRQRLRENTKPPAGRLKETRMPE